MRDRGRCVVGLPRNTSICTLEQLFNLGQLLVGRCSGSEDFFQAVTEFWNSSFPVQEPRLHAHKADRTLLSLDEGGDPFFPQRAEVIASHPVSGPLLL